MASKLGKAASAKNIGKKKKVIVPLYPPGLPLSDIWYTYSDLILMITVQRKVTYRYIQKGILRVHACGGTVRFSKVYVDLMFQNGGKKFAWFGWPMWKTGKSHCQGQVRKISSGT